MERIDMESRQLIENNSASEARPEGVDNTLDLHRVIESFQKHKLLLFLSVAIGLALAFLVCVFMTPRYDAVTYLNIHPESSAALDLGDLAELASGAGGLDWDAKVQTEVLIISSEPRAWDVITQLRLDQNPTFMRPGILGFLGECKMRVTPAGKSIETVPPCLRYQLLQRFSKALEVEALPKSQVVSIRFRSTDPRLAADVVNRLASSYLQYNFVTRYQATMQASGWLHDRLTEMKKDVEDAGAQLADYQKNANIIGTDETDNLAVNQLSDMGKQVTDAEADRILKEAKYRLAMTGNPELIGTIVPDSVLPTLRSQEAQLNTGLAQAKAEYGARYPKVVQLQSQLDEVHKALATETADIQARFKSEYDAALHTEADLKQSMDLLKQDAFSQSAKFNKYVLLKNEADAKEQLYDDLLKKLNEAGVSAGLKSTNVDIIASADVPVKPALPNVPVFLAVGTAAGLIFGVLSTITIENLNRSVRSIEDVTQIVNLPIMGMLPHVSPDNLRSSADSELRKSVPLLQVVIQRPQSEYAEAISALRSALLLASAGAPPKIIMLTSSLPSEGKSLTSVNFAASLALAGRRVLLVDADLRRGALVARGASRQMSGLTGCLSGATAWREQVQPVPLDSGTLMILPSGIRPPNPAELLGSQTMESLVEEWRREFDFVLFDTPPVAIVTDGVVLSPLMDAVLLIVRINKTSRLALRESYSRLQMVSRKLIGVIANDMDLAKQYYGYGYGSYRKYYTYYESREESQ
ncbi:MAG: polysaccharide biosynthesis tyrosine autokinase [Terracidiphilus sp.]|jgi:capsular exopolysaccharide synthesis family protein